MPDWIDWTDWDAAQRQVQQDTSWTTSDQDADCRINTASTWTARQPQHLERLRRSTAATANAPKRRATTTPTSLRRTIGHHRHACSAGRAVRLLPAGRHGAELQLDGDDHAGQQHVARPATPTRRSALQLGWMSLVGGGPFPTPPAKDPNYKYQQVIILLTDGLNTQDRWYTEPDLDRRAPADDLQQRQGRRHHALHFRSTPAANVLLPLRPRTRYACPEHRS